MLYRKNIIFCICFFFTLVYFFIVATNNLDKLGLNIDESTRGIETLDFLSQFKITNYAYSYSPYYLKNLYGENKVLIIGGVAFPMMQSFFNGMIVDYFLAPLFLLFGHSVYVFRFLQIIFAVVSLICIFYVLSRFFNPLIGFTVFFLLAINSSYIRAVRVATKNEEILQIFLVWLGVSFIQYYIDRRGKFFFFLSAFFWGLALSAKLEFLGYLVAGIVSAGIFYKKSYCFLKEKIFRSFFDIFFFIFFFVLGSFPLLYFNVSSSGKTIKSLLNSLLNVNCYGRSNLSFFSNFWNRICDYFDLLLRNNSIVYDSIEPMGSYVALAVFIISLIGVFIYLLIDKKDIVLKVKIKFVLVCYLVLLITTVFVPNTYSSEHILITFPVVEVIIAFFVNLIFQFVKKGTVATLLVGLLLVPYVGQEIYIMKEFRNEVKLGKANCDYCPIMYPFSEYLLAQNIKHVYSFAQIFDNNTLEFLTERKISAKDYWWSLHDGIMSIEQIYNNDFRKLDSFYLVTLGERDVTIWLNSLNKLLAAAGKNIRLVKIFENEAKNSRLDLYLIS